ncbi:hypothetical protein ACKWTF_013787 [Chironomus riparius]
MINNCNSQNSETEAWLDDNEERGEVEIEILNFYDENEEDLVARALTDMGWSFLIEKFKEEKIDYDCFLNLNSFYIHQLLKGFKLGWCIKFEKGYKEWKCKHELETSHTTLMQLETKTIIKAGIIETILNATQIGRDFLHDNDRNLKLERTKESDLCDLICSYFFAKQQLITAREFGLLAEDIQATYPKELASIYYSKLNYKNTGVLYDKYNNKLRTLRSNKLMPGSSRKRKAENNQTLEPNNQAFTQEEVNSNDFVKFTTANIEFAVLESHWRRSSQVRIDAFKQMSEYKFSSIYRALLRADGHELINIDFEYLYPGRNFKDRWNESQQQTIEILKRNKAQEVLAIKFSKISSMSPNQSLATILLGLHNLLSGDRVSCGDKKKIIYKPTVYDSFGFMLLLVDDENSMEIEYRNWIRKNNQKSLKQQAVIIGVGGSIENLKDKFCVILEDMKYLFEGVNSLLFALERLMQMYYVFNIEYPAANTSVYTFLSIKYLSIIDSKSTNGIRSKISRLLNEYN